MTLLYTEQDLQEIQGQEKRRLTAVIPFWILFTVLTVISMIFRLEWLTMVSLCLLAATTIFWLDFIFLPLKRYERHLRSALHGKRFHDEHYTFSAIEPDLSVVDGVTYRSIIVLGDADRHGIRERMYYWDKEKEIPDFQEGSDITLRYYDKMIIGWA